MLPSGLKEQRPPIHVHPPPQNAALLGNGSLNPVTCVLRTGEDPQARVTQGRSHVGAGQRARACGCPGGHTGGWERQPETLPPGPPSEV